MNNVQLPYNVLHIYAHAVGLVTIDLPLPTMG